MKGKQRNRDTGKKLPRQELWHTNSDYNRHKKVRKRKRGGVARAVADGASAAPSLCVANNEEINIFSLVIRKASYA